MSGESFDEEDISSDESEKFGKKRRKVSSDDDFEPPGPSTSKAKKPPAKRPEKKPLVKKEPKEKKPRKPAAAKPKKEPVLKPKKEPVVKPKKEPSTKPKKAPAPKKPTVPKLDEYPDGDVAKSTPFPGMQWNVSEYLAELQQVQVHVASNLVRLLKEDNTIPFIARYRQEMVGGLGPEKLREMKDTFEMLERVTAKAAAVRDGILKENKLTRDIEMIVCHARSIEELDYIYMPFKRDAKGTLANRARALGLEDFAMAVLETGRMPRPLAAFVDTAVEGLLTEQQVVTGVQHIIAEAISKEKCVLDQVREVKARAKILLTVSKAKKPLGKAESKAGVKVKAEDPAQESQFERYFNFSSEAKRLRPHQVLAINRGEKLKVLSVKVVVDDWAQGHLHAACLRRWAWNGVTDARCSEIVENSFADAYQRLLAPLLARQVRSELNASATRASIDVFAANLKDLLLAPPTRGQPILGIDPGYRNGCKLGVISATGQPLHTDVIYPNFSGMADPVADPGAKKLREIVRRYECSLVALGNGTACRETETFISELIKRQWFAPLDVRYTIVSEQGVSIYSCSPLATQEFPTSRPNEISAVSLARRIQDPLSELVKVEPQHLGVGMYQLDAPPKQLGSSLAQVVEECVSFVGVDLNAASETILKFVSGLNAGKVGKIVEWRSANGPFLNREQLKLVTGVGEKCYQQCAGFVRIIPETCIRVKPECSVKAEEAEPKRGTKRKRAATFAPEPLDRTWIHPESYDAARKFMARCSVDPDDIGTPAFIGRVRECVEQTGLPTLAADLAVDEAAMKLMSDGLQQLPGQDLRSASSKPLFRSSATTMEGLVRGQTLTGRAENVTHFGVFVDIGVGKSGLLHESKIPRGVKIHLGDRLEVRVLEVKLREKRVSLAFVRHL